MARWKIEISPGHVVQQAEIQSKLVAAFEAREVIASEENGAWTFSLTTDVDEIERVKDQIEAAGLSSMRVRHIERVE